jgi:DNA-binding transcriptional ArsR family regulator
MTIEARRDVFQAIADPTRRDIISLIADVPMNLNTIAGNFNISRPAISQHIKILEECGLVVIHQQGRERFCEAHLEQLNEVLVWVEQYKQHWNKRLDSLENYLDQLQKHRKHGKNKK